MDDSHVRFKRTFNMSNLWFFARWETHADDIKTDHQIFEFGATTPVGCKLHELALFAMIHPELRQMIGIRLD